MLQSRAPTGATDSAHGRPAVEWRCRRGQSTWCSDEAAHGQSQTGPIEVGEQESRSREQTMVLKRGYEDGDCIVRETKVRDVKKNRENFEDDIE